MGTDKVHNGIPSILIECKYLYSRLRLIGSLQIDCVLSQLSGVTPRDTLCI